MDAKTYQKIVLEILKFYQENYCNEGFNFSDISKFCKNTLDLKEKVYMEILIDMQKLCLVEHGFEIKCNFEGLYVVSTSGREPRITPLGLEFIDDNKIFNKVLKNTKSILELVSILK